MYRGEHSTATCSSVDALRLVAWRGGIVVLKEVRAPTRVVAQILSSDTTQRKNRLSRTALL